MYKGIHKSKYVTNEFVLTNKKAELITKQIDYSGGYKWDYLELMESGV